MFSLHRGAKVPFRKQTFKHRDHQIYCKGQDTSAGEPTLEEPAAAAGEEPAAAAGEGDPAAPGEGPYDCAIPGTIILKYGDVVYYEIEVSRGTASWKVLRRYSEFFPLREQLEKGGIVVTDFPRRHLFGSNTDGVVAGRKMKLLDFVKCFVLSNDQNSACRAFLELDQYQLMIQTLEGAYAMVKQADGSGARVVRGLVTLCFVSLVWHLLRMQLCGAGCSAVVICGAEAAAG